MDHNICVGIDGRCQIVSYENGKIDWGRFKPGEYAGHNIVERRAAENIFVNFDPKNFTYNLQLRPGAPAIGAGNPDGAPAVDITGAKRGDRIDIGAYHHIPPK